MKKVLKIVGIVLVVIVLLMIAIPFLFKGKIKDAVLNAANEQLEATVSIEDFGLNLFSNFPSATLSLKNTKVVGKGDFAKDTLLNAKDVSVTIDLSSLFGDNYKISKINLNDVSVLAKIIEDGRANWDIMKEDSTTVTESDDSSSSAFNLNLKEIVVKNVNIVYNDLEGKMKADIKGWNGIISGDFSASETTLKTKSTIDALSVSQAGVTFINKVKTVANATVKADLDKMSFKFIDSDLRLNELQASIDGTFGMPNDDRMDFDLKLNAPNTKFKDILSIVPAMYTAEFKNVKTDGAASLDAYIKGKMEGDIYPAFDVKLNVANAMFQYPDLPQGVNNINIVVAVINKEGSLDNMLIDVSKFTFALGGNPFQGGVKITTPMSDANVAAHANGTIDLGMIKNVYPLPKETELNGKITADLNLAVKMSTIEKELYDQVQAKGSLSLKDMILKSKGSQDIHISNAVLELTPRYINLNPFDMTIGKNDLSVTGRLENFVAFAMKNKTLKGQLNINSNYLNLNDFMSDEEVAVEDTTTVSSENIIIPKNIDFALNANLKKVVFSKIDITNVNGAMVVNNGVLDMKNVSANLLAGSCKVTGAYNTSNPKLPKVNFALDLANVSFAQTFKSVEMIQKLAPIFENMQGTYGLNFDFNTTLGATSDQTLHALNGNGTIKTNDLKIENVKALNALADILKADGLRTITAKDVNIQFAVKDGRITTKPFNLNMGKGGELKLEGSTGLDQTIDYKGTVTLPKGMTNDYVNNVPLTIKGSFDSPKIGIDSKALAGQALGGIADKLLGGKDGENSKVSDIASKVLGGGEKSQDPEKIRADAKANGEKLVAEAKKQAENLEKEAGSNKLKQAGAKLAGKALVTEAEKQAKKMNEKAEERAKEIEAAVPAE